jgi:hypothetical protein
MVRVCLALYATLFGSLLLEVTADVGLLCFPVHVFMFGKQAQNTLSPPNVAISWKLEQTCFDLFVLYLRTNCHFVVF